VGTWKKTLFLFVNNNVFLGACCPCSGNHEKYETPGQYPIDG